MHMVGLKTLKNKLSEYVRLAASGETVVITDRNRVVAEIVPPRRDTNAFFERGVREGWLSPPRNPSAEPRPCPGPRPHAQRRYAIVDRATEAGGVDTAGLGSRNSPFLFPFAPSTRFISATIDFIRGQGETVELASYDSLLLMAARALGITLLQL